MLVFPFAKINLGLQVLRKRPDGYHDIRSALFPIPLYDALEAVVDGSVPRGEVRFVRTGIPVPGDPASDLCMKAVEQVRKLRELPGLRMHLHKAIPTGAGLGGGSSDGAHTLLLLNDLLSLQIPRAQLHGMATELGSDCPFFLHRTPQLAEGRGEILSPIDVDLEGHWIALVNPGLHVSTAEAYRNLELGSGHGDLREQLASPPATWQGKVTNDMEPRVFADHPSIGNIKRKLLTMGAIYAAMSGSGASVFGIFTGRPEDLGFPDDHEIRAFKP